MITSAPACHEAAQGVDLGEVRQQILQMPCNELHAGTPNPEAQRAYGDGFRCARDRAADILERVCAQKAAADLPPSTAFAQGKATIMALSEDDVRQLAISQFILLQLHEKYAALNRPSGWLFRVLDDEGWSRWQYTHDRPPKARPGHVEVKQVFTGADPVGPLPGLPPERILGHSTVYGADAGKSLRPVKGYNAEDLRAFGEAARQDELDRRREIAQGVRDAIPTRDGVILAAMIEEGVTALQSHIAAAIDSMATKALGMTLTGREREELRAGACVFRIPPYDVNETSQRIGDLMERIAAAAGAANDAPTGMHEQCQPGSAGQGTNLGRPQ